MTAISFIFIEITSIYDIRSFCFTRNNIEVDWNQLTEQDWNTIDILGHPKADRPYLKMTNKAFFLGELTLQGKIIELDFDSVERMPAKVQFPERERREVKLGELHKSPFRERTIDIDKPTLSKAEEDVWKWLNANNDYPL